MISASITVKDIPRIPFEKARPALQLTLTQGALMVQNKAKENSPYHTGTLRRSITTDYSMMNTGKAVVWTNTVYARRREFENNKNPHTKYYMERAMKDSEANIRDLFLRNIKWAFQS